MKDEFVKFLEAKRNEWNEIKEERKKLRGLKKNLIIFRFFLVILNVFRL